VSSPPRCPLSDRAAERRLHGGHRDARATPRVDQSMRVGVEARRAKDEAQRPPVRGREVPFPGLIALTAELAVVVLGCFLAGLPAKTPIGRRIGRAVEARLFEKVPGYNLLRSLTRTAMGEEEDVRYKVALVEIEGGLVPSFIIEEHNDGHCTVFVPAVPTPTSGSIYIFPREMVHLVDVPFAKALRCMTKLGAGSGDLLQAMRRS